MVNFILGTSGTGKSETLLGKIEQAVDSGKDICVIIPDQFSFEYDKKLYNRLGVKKFHSVEVLSFARLAKDIFLTEGGSSGVYADDLTKISLMYLAIREMQAKNGFSFYDKQAKSPRFVGMALNIVKELRAAGISPEELTEKIDFLHESVREKTADVALLYTTYQRIMTERGFKDSLNDISEAARIAAKSGYFKGKTVFVDEFKSYTGDQYEMFDAVISDAEDLYLTLTADNLSGKPGSLFSINHRTYAVIAEIAENYGVPVKAEYEKISHRFKYDDLRHVSESVFRLGGKVLPSAEHIHIYESAEVYSEADFVCAEISRLVREEGYRYGEIAVAARNLEDYAGTLEAAFARYDIPYFMDRKEPFLHKSFILMILSALEIASRKTPDTESILRFGKTGYAGLSYEEVSALENYCYKWNVEGKVWNGEFREDEEFPGVNELRERLVAPVNELRSRAENASGKEVCSAVYGLLESLGIEKTLNERSSESDEALTLIRETKQLWNTVVSILDSLYKTLGDEVVKLSDFTEIFTMMLAGSSFAVPPQTLDSVAVVGAERTRFASPRAVFVIGVNEGIFPYSPKASGLFTDKDKAFLEEAGVSVSPPTKSLVMEERFISYSVISAPSEELYLTYPLSDAGGKTLFPSYIIEQICGMFEGLSPMNTESLDKLLYCVTEKSAYYHYVQDYNKNCAEIAAVRSVLEEDDGYRGKLAVLDRIGFGSEFSISDKALAKKVFGEKMAVSPSRFEDYNNCPFMYFCKKGLKLYAPKKIEINAVEQGNMIHHCLCETMKSMDKTAFVSADREKLSELIIRLLNAYYEEKMGGSFAKTARFHANLKALSDTILEVLLHLQKEFSQSEFVPEEFELKINGDSDVKPRKLVSKNGIEIYFTGTIDRVDTYANGGKTYVRVVDYKSGKKVFRLEDLLYGLNMQMLLYLFTVTESGGKYSESLPAGVLYMPSHEPDKIELDRNSTKEEREIAKDKSFKMNGILLENRDVLNAMEKDLRGIYIPVAVKKDNGYTALSSLITEKQIANLKKYADKLLTEMADGLSEGKIPAKPLMKNKIGPCEYCDYSTICGRELSSFRCYEADAKAKILDIMDGKGVTSDEKTVD